MKLLGKKSPTRAFRICSIALAAAAAAAAASPVWGADGFLIPGVALSEADFEVGAWCRYLVVDEIMGAKDSTSVYIAVTGRVERGGTPSAWWLELENGPVGAAPSQRELALALVSSQIKDSAPGDSLSQYVSELYLKKGSGDVERADPSDLEQLRLSNPTSDADWEITRGESVVTPRGEFTCDHKHLRVNNDREIDMGKVTLIKKDTDLYDVWLNKDVPIFHVVKCVIERVRDSRTVPQVPGIPNKESELTTTTVVLIDFGGNAAAKLKIP